MKFERFTKEDFNVFTVDGLDERMGELKKQVRPKLESLGEIYAPFLSSLCQEEMFAHVAKHARRSVNPPKDTWVAFAANKRGYKRHPHFQIGLFESHVFIWFAVIYEADIKTEYGKVLKTHIEEIENSIPSYFVWSKDHTKPDTISMEDLSREDLTALFDRLEKVKKAEILCGLRIPQKEAIEMSKDEWDQTFKDAFTMLLPLYKLGATI
ncbi:YktB family protein [Priestia endophytica]|uniref:UPF0637 protein A3864_23805 n=1 Tax=Priestia endophytica TaxID=135735 RepID=A0AAX1Q255_9BACI|nr:DUF1054 domain-containing protein [Priestia endophytica]RAS72102.1 hypothetical protein A3864_23805 [Priestia endophytica]